MREMDSAKIGVFEYSESVSELSEAETSGEPHHVVDYPAPRT